MSTPEESPAQKAARLRRERREAKIREDGAARLDKITSLSGRASTSGMIPFPPIPITPDKQFSPMHLALWDWG